MSTQKYQFGFTNQRLRIGWYAVLSVLVLIGVAAGLWRLLNGISVTNLTATVPWGNWVAFYIYFVGLSAGAFLVSVLATVLDIEKYHEIERDALFVAIVSMGIALLFIQMDLGRPDRAIYPLLHRQIMSVLSWEVHAYMLYILVLTGELYFSMRRDLVEVSRHGTGLRSTVASVLTLGRTDISSSALATDRTWIRRLGLAGVPLAIMFVHGGTGMLFAVNNSVSYWHSGLFPVIFIVSAVLSGTGLIIALYVARAVVFDNALNRDLLAGLGKLLGVFILIDIALKTFDTVVGIYGLTPSKVATWEQILTGEVAWAVYFMMTFAWLVPLVLISRSQWRQSPKTMGIAGASAAVGVIGTRFMIVITALSVPDMEGLPVGAYSAGPIEWAFAIGMIGLFALLYTVGAELLPLRPLGGDHQ